MSTPAEITELIQSSGNNFHAKVARWFADHEWHVEISPYYMDQSQSKAREIDLIVEKNIAPVTNFSSGKKADIVVRLFIECKFVAQHSVFWFVKKNKDAALKLVCKHNYFEKNNSYTNKHHYLTNENVAKVFTSANSNKNNENDPFYKALNQALNSMVSMLGRRVSIPSIVNARHQVQTIVLEFPVVICHSFDKLFSVEFFSESLPKPIDENFQLEVQYAYIDITNNPRNDYFLIDFISFEKIEKFVNTVEDDAKILSEVLSD
jgi:hypothetical protein